jgi:hypothetical protein
MLDKLELAKKGHKDVQGKLVPNFAKKKKDPNNKLSKWWAYNICHGDAQMNLHNCRYSYGHRLE